MTATETSMELGLDDNSSRIIHIRSSEGIEVPISIQNCKLSKMLTNTLDNDPTLSVIPCPMYDPKTLTNEQKASFVSTETLRNIVEYLNHHKGVAVEKPPQKPLRTNDMKVALSDTWDAEFITRLTPKRQPLYDIILAANYFGIECLIQVGCCKFASLLRGRNLEQARMSLDPTIAHNPTGEPDEIVAVPENESKEEKMDE